MSAKRGRPTSNPKKEYIIVRATQQDKELLKECCQQLAQTQYEVVMDGIRMVYSNIQTFKNLESERGEVMEHNIIFDLVKADQKYVKQYQDDCVFNASIKLLMEGSFSIPTVIEVVSKLCQLNGEREKQLREMHDSTLPLNVVINLLKNEHK